MNDIVKKYDRKLREASAALDLTPTQTMKAIRSYRAVGAWLDVIYPGLSGRVELSPQGSFLHGTTVKPDKRSSDPRYDIDLVCLVPADKKMTAPGSIKKFIGDRLRAHETYKTMLDDEGRRCWILDYALDGEGIGFNLDVLPCVPEEPTIISKIKQYGVPPALAETSVAITNCEKRQDTYSWTTSNPRGYGRWFEMRNATALKSIIEGGKRLLFEAHRELFNSAEEVPAQLVKTPLQRAIQILKRHRDVRFAGRENEDDKPISMIITTLAAYLYTNEQDVIFALRNIVEQLRLRSQLLTGPRIFPEGVNVPDLIIRQPDGRWYIGNPVNPGENFADRWHENNDAKAKAFFQWVAWVKEDLIDLLNHAKPDALTETVDRALGLEIPPLPKSSKSYSSLILPATVQDNVPHVEIKSANRPWAKKN